MMRLLNLFHNGHIKDLAYTSDILRQHSFLLLPIMFSIFIHQLQPISNVRLSTRRDYLYRYTIFAHVSGLNQFNSPLVIYLDIIMSFLHLFHHGNIQDSESTIDILCQYSFLLIPIMFSIFIHQL